jgi:hypothetical protein
MPFTDPKVVYIKAAYISGVFAYNIVGAYVDSKIYLKKHREGKLSELGIIDNWDAVTYGAKLNASNRLSASFYWPYSSIVCIVPEIVLLLNPPKN